MSNWNLFNEEATSEENMEANPAPLAKLSIVIPTFNCSQSIAITLKSILNQDYPDFEILIIDANSTDRTLEIVKSFHDQRIHIHTVAAYHPFEMLNRGISVAGGDYIQFLFPGDYYLQISILKKVVRIASLKENPYLIYGASLDRGGEKEPTIFFRPFSLFHLKRGEGPTALQGCWFNRDLFKKIDRFSSVIKIRADYEFFCRLFTHVKDLHLHIPHDTNFRNNPPFVSFQLVVVDSKTQESKQRDILRHLFETSKIICNYFGWLPAVKWWIFQKETRKYCLLKFEQAKKAFSRRIS